MGQMCTKSGAKAYEPTTMMPAQRVNPPNLHVEPVAEQTQEEPPAPPAPIPVTPEPAGARANEEAQALGILLPSQLFAAKSPASPLAHSEADVESPTVAIPVQSPSQVMQTPPTGRPGDDGGMGRPSSIPEDSPAMSPPDELMARPSSTSPLDGGFVPSLTRDDSRQLMRARGNSLSMRRDMDGVISFCLDNNCGELSGSTLVPVDKGEYGQFNRANAYVCVYQYHLPGDEAAKAVVYMWLGNEASQVARGKAAVLASQAGWSQGDHTEFRVEEGEEPSHFMTLFGETYTIG